MIRWLPRWRTATNPFCSRIRQISDPERTRSLPNRDLNLSHENLVARAPGDFGRGGSFEEQRKRLDEVSSRFFNGGALARDVELRAQRRKNVVLKRVANGPAWSIAPSRFLPGVMNSFNGRLTMPADSPGAMMAAGMLLIQISSLRFFASKRAIKRGFGIMFQLNSILPRSSFPLKTSTSLVRLPHKMQAMVNSALVGSRENVTLPPNMRVRVRNLKSSNSALKVTLRVALAVMTHPNAPSTPPESSISPSGSMFPLGPFCVGVFTAASALMLIAPSPPTLRYASANPAHFQPMLNSADNFIKSSCSEPE